MSRILAHTVRGQGDSLWVLLHGFLGSGRNLASLARRIVEARPDVRIVLPDLTGHGHSPPLPPNATLATLAEDVLATVDELWGPQSNVYVVGHSLGGRVGLAMALLAPARLQRVTLIDISPAPTSSSLAAARGEGPGAVVPRLLSAPDSAADRESFRTHFAATGLSSALIDWLLLNLERRDDGLHWRIDRKALANLHDTGLGGALWPALDVLAPGQLHCIRGALSGFVSDADAQRIRDGGHRVDTVPNAGHFVHVEQQAALLERLLESF